MVSLLSRQLRQLATSPPEGITLIPSDSMSEILADIAGPEKTPYEGGKFRVKLVLGSDYPAAPPKGLYPFSRHVLISMSSIKMFL